MYNITFAPTRKDDSLQGSITRSRMTLQVGWLDADGLWLGEEDGTLDTITTTLDGASVGLELGNLESEGVALG